MKMADHTTAFDEQPFVTVPYDGKLDWLALDITEQMKKWLAAPETNNGILLKFAKEREAPFAGWQFTSVWGDEADRPKIVFECE